MIVCLCLGTALSIMAKSEEPRTLVSGPLTIDAVTIYQNRAMVVRSIPGEVVPGLYTWKFPDLPGFLLEDSVRVAGRGTAAARIIDIRIQRTRSSESVKDMVKNLEKKRQEIDTRAEEIADRLDVLNKQGELVRGLSVLKVGEEKPAVTGQGEGPDGWRKRLEFIDSQLTRILEQARMLNAEKRELEKKRAVVQHDLDQQASTQAREKRVVLVDVDVTKAGTERLELSFVVPGVSWTPCYDLRVDSQKSEANLTYQALVNQETGEDWNDVHLSLSTAAPALEHRPRQLQPWLVNTMDSQLGAISCLIRDSEGNPLPGVSVTVTSDVFRKVVPSDGSGRTLFPNLKPGAYDLRAELPGFKSYISRGIDARAGRSARLSIDMEIASLEEQVTIASKVQYGEIAPAAAPPSEPEADMEIETAEASDRTVATVFDLKQRQSIPSSTESKKVTIALEAVPVEKEYVSIPKLAESVSLIAKITNAASFALLPGPASLFYDNDYVATAPIPRVSASDRFSVSLGDVPGVKARWQLISKKRSETGLVGKKVQLTYEIKITLESLLRVPQTVVVKDQIPVTTSKDVTIEILQVTPEPLKAAAEDDETKAGVLSWSIPLAPAEKKEINLRFRITHPKNSPLIDGGE
jgi:hypothetical protein